MLSVKDPLQVVIIKGFGSGLGSLVISFVIKETSTNIVYIFATFLLGFVAYGLSIYFYVYAQRELGAARTSAYYAIAPFIGVALSFIIFLQVHTVTFIININAKTEVYRALSILICLIALYLIYYHNIV